ncbi:MAG: energy transducer TonB [Gemmatimonadales bacterium]
MFNVLIASGRMKAPRPVGGVVASMIAHGALLAAILLGSRPAIHVASEFEERIAEYLFPKDRAPELGDRIFDHLRVPGGGTASPASVGGTGAGAGQDSRAKTTDALKLQVERPAAGATGTPDLIAQQQKMAESLGAFALLDVDSGAVRDPHSAAPAYPRDMEERGIEGTVRVRFVVDSTGRIDLSTIKILDSTNSSFAREVRAALPDMRFRPAMIGGHPVRQLSEQGFAFKVLVKHDSATSKPRP